MQNQEFLIQRPAAEVILDQLPLVLGSFALAALSHYGPFLDEIAEWPWWAREAGESFGHPVGGVVAFVFVEAFLYSKSALSRNTKILVGATAADAVLEVGIAKYSGEPIRGIISSTNILENFKDYMATLSGIGACFILDKSRLRRQQGRF